MMEAQKAGRHSRRDFSKAMALGWTQSAVRKPRKLPVGHTGITWMTFGKGGSRPDDVNLIETIIRDISGLGYHGVELFGNAVAALDAGGDLGRLLRKYGNLPLIGIVAGPDCANPAKLKESIQTMAQQGAAARKLGARIVLMNAGGRREENYNFSQHKANIAKALNEAGKAMADLGLQAVLHQHTGTMVEKRDEVYGIMDAIDTRVVKAGFDVGQLSKGGADPVEIVRDFLPLIEHLHLKDYDGGQHYVGYCPLGRGKVDLPAILDLVESKGSLKGMVMVELDPSTGMPLPAAETAKIARAFLEKQGYAFGTPRTK